MNSKQPIVLFGMGRQLSRDVKITVEYLDQVKNGFVIPSGKRLVVEEGLGEMAWILPDEI